MAELVKANDADFDEKVLRSDKPVLVEFFGSWGAPCLKMKPMLEEMAAELEGKAAVVQVEVAEAPETAGTYGVMGLPMLMVFVGGEPKETLVGSPSKADILKALTAHVPV